MCTIIYIVYLSLFIYIYIYIYTYTYILARPPRWRRASSSASRKARRPPHNTIYYCRVCLYIISYL